MDLYQSCLKFRVFIEGKKPENSNKISIHTALAAISTVFISVTGLGFIKEFINISLL